MTKETVILNIPKWADEALGRQNAEIFSIIYNATNGSRKYFDGSINYIIKQTGKSKSTILRRLKELEEIGAIKRVGYNQYKNVKYVSIVNKDTIAKCQNDTLKDSKVSKCQSVKMKPCRCQNDTLQSFKMTPYKSIINNTDLINKKDIYKKHIYLKKDMSSTLDEIERLEDNKMVYKAYQEDTYNKTINGWWKHYNFFADDEELNDLFIKLLDKTSQEENNYSGGCSIIYDLVSTARLKMKDSDIEIQNMTDDEFNALPQEDLQPIDTTCELKSVLRDFVYNANKEALHIYLGLIA